MAINKEISIKTPYICLGQLIKYLGLAESGGDVKMFLNNSDIRINNLPDIRRGRKLYKGDLVAINGKEYKIC